MQSTGFLYRFITILGAAVAAFPVPAIAATPAGGCPSVDEMSQITRLFFGWGPFVLLLIIAFLLHWRLKRMEALQQEELEKVQRKETILQTRERHILAYMLEGELTENKNRIEAFLSIYRETLRDMQDTKKIPKYQQAGDIVQKHPLLSKAVFTTNLSKLSVFDMKLSGQLSKLYALLPEEQEYITIEANVPLDTAIKVVEKILKDAADLLPLISSTVESLEGMMTKKPD